MTWLLRSTRDGGDFVPRAADGAGVPPPALWDSPAPSGAHEDAWAAVWHVLGGGLPFTVAELTSFEPSITAGLARRQVSDLLGDAVSRGHVTACQRAREWNGPLEYARKVGATSGNAES